MKIDAILIDDDIWVRSTWEDIGRRYCKNFVTVATPEELYIKLRHQTKDVPLFLDVELGGSVSGITLAKDLFKQGFHHIFLSTSHDSKDFDGIDYIAGVVDKKPPAWLLEESILSGKISAEERRFLRERMTLEQVDVFSRRMKQYEDALYGLDGSTWLDGIGSHYPEVVLDAWEKAIYLSLSDEAMKEMTDKAWNLALKPKGS